jgi:hypothetical protein
VADVLDEERGGQQVVEHVDRVAARAERDVPIGHGVVRGEEGRADAGVRAQYVEDVGGSPSRVHLVVCGGGKARRDRQRVLHEFLHPQRWSGLHVPAVSPPQGLLTRDGAQGASGSIGCGSVNRARTLPVMRATSLS